MTVSTVYTGPAIFSGGTAVLSFSFPHKVMDDSDLYVTIITGSVSAPLSLGSGYTVSGAGPSSISVDVNLTNPVPSGSYLYVYRVSDNVQAVDFINGDAFDSAAFESGLDRLTLVDQEHNANRISDAAAITALQAKDVLLQAEIDALEVLEAQDRADINARTMLPVANTLLGYGGGAAPTLYPLAATSGGVWDARGPFAGRAAYTAQAAGFTYLVTDSLPLAFYIRGANPGSWEGPNYVGLNEVETDIIHAKRHGVVADGVTPIGTALQALFDAVAVNRTIYFGPGYYLLDKCVKLTQVGIHLIFDANAVFLVRDDGASGVLLNGASGKVGLHFQQAHSLCISGYGRFLGQGTIGSTPLAGMVFEKCFNARVPDSSYYENMAAGRFVMWCDYSVFGDILAYRMKGTQTFDAGTAGTAEVCVGNAHSSFGKIHSIENYKPVRYLSVGADHLGQHINNAYCDFGMCSGTGEATSIESSLVSIRSAVDCTFEGSSGTGFSLGLYIVRSAGDAQYSITGVKYGFQGGDFPANGASLNSCVAISAPAAQPVGTVHIGTIRANCAGEHGLYVGAGRVRVDSLDVTGSVRPVVLQDCEFSAGLLAVSGQTNEGVVIGAGAVCDIQEIALKSGPVSAISGGVRYWSSFGTGGKKNIRIGRISYAQNGSPNHYTHTFLDLENSFETTAIDVIDGAGSSAMSRFGSDSYSVNKGRYHGAAPTTMTYAVNSQVWRSAPAAGGPPGDVCVTAGTPGTWKAMANLAA